MPSEICPMCSFDGLIYHPEKKKPAAQVAGRMECSLAAHELRLGILIAEEQERANPNNTLIAALCDSIRLVREVNSGIPEHLQAQVLREQSEELARLNKLLNTP